MATVTFNGKTVGLAGQLPQVGAKAPEIRVVKGDLSELRLSDLAGKRVILNIFPSLDTAVCAMSVRRFNKVAAALENTVVLCISKDLPFAQGRFCSAEGIEDVIPASAFRSREIDEAYGLGILDGPLKGLLSRAVVVVDENGTVVYGELVDEITHEPDYIAALEALK